MNKVMEKDEIFAEADQNTKAATDSMLESAFGPKEGSAVPEKGEETADVLTEEQEPAVDVKAMLAGLPSGPQAEQIDAWKAQHGEVYILPLDVTEMYVWRPLRHLEYKTMLKGDMAKDDESFREAVVLRSLLWPQLTPNQVAATRAGLMDTLFQVIMQGSYFLNPDLALQLVQKL